MINRKTMEDRAERLNRILAGKDPVPGKILCREIWHNNRMQCAYVLQPGGNDSGCSGSPAIYPGSWWEKTDAEAADYLINTFHSAAFRFDETELPDPGYVKSRILPRVTASDKNLSGLEKNHITHRAYLNLSALYYIPVDFLQDEATIQVSDHLLARIGLSADEAHEAAMKNLAGTTEILTMDSLLAGWFPEEEGIPSETAKSMWVITNKAKMFGAAVLLFDEELYLPLEKKYRQKIAVLPSSTHEVIAVPYREEKDLWKYLDIVKAVNRNQVPEEERLCDNVYFYDHSRKLVRTLV